MNLLSRSPLRLPARAAATVALVLTLAGVLASPAGAAEAAPITEFKGKFATKAACIDRGEFYKKAHGADFYSCPPVKLVFHLYVTWST